MKWPSSITLIRHGESKYNELRRKKDADERYRLFKRAFNKNPDSDECRALALEVKKKFSLGMSDYATPLTETGACQALTTGQKIKTVVPEPDVLIVSPYMRTRGTLANIAESWREIQNKTVVFDDRIREQEHGLSLLYNDWRVFETLHPEQRELRNILGPYWYQYPQGESAAQVRDRIRSFTATLIREYAGMHVMLVTHHLTILSIRASYERLSPEDFIRLDEHEKPLNCGVTLYRGNPSRGSDGKLELAFYNRCFWKEE